MNRAKKKYMSFFSTTERKRKRRVNLIVAVSVILVSVVSAVIIGEKIYNEQSK